MPNVEHWTISRVVGADGSPRGPWQLGLIDEYPEHSELEVVELVDIRQLEQAADLLREARAYVEDRAGSVLSDKDSAGELLRRIDTHLGGR